MLTDQEKEEAKKLLKMLDRMKEITDKAMIKRLTLMLASLLIDMSAVGLQFLNVIPFEVTLIIVFVVMAISLYLNHLIHKGVQKSLEEVRTDLHEMKKSMIPEEKI